MNEHLSVVRVQLGYPGSECLRHTAGEVIPTNANVSILTHANCNQLPCRVGLATAGTSVTSTSVTEICDRKFDSLFLLLLQSLCQRACRSSRRRPPSPAGAPCSPPTASPTLCPLCPSGRGSEAAGPRARPSLCSKPRWKRRRQRQRSPGKTEPRPKARSWFPDPTRREGRSLAAR